MVKVPFTAEAIGTYIFAGPDTLEDPRCTGELSAWRAIVEAHGTGDPVGDFTVYFDFCGDMESHYGNGEAYLVDESNDTLFLEVSGQVLDGRLDSHPEYVVSYWKDNIGIGGGTGKYADASGTLISDDFNSSLDNNSHHHWTGEITMREK